MLSRLGSGGEDSVVPVEFFFLPLSDPCSADLNGDGDVDSADLAILLGSWGDAIGQADLDGSGEVGSAELR